MEMMDVYSAQKIRQPKIHQRDISMAAGDYRFVVTVLVFNSKNELLIQKRQSTKHSWPDYWDYSASGAVSAGEEIYLAAERELMEETGVKVSLKDVPSRMTVAFNEGWDEIYFVTKDVAADEIKIQTEEVAEVRWVREEEYLQLVEDGSFIPYIYARSIFDFHRSTSEHFV